MTRETCKALLENGVLQAYADGKMIEYRNSLGVWNKTQDTPDFSASKENYRIAKVTKWVGLFKSSADGEICVDGNDMHPRLYNSEEEARSNQSLHKIVAVFPVEIEP